MKNSCKNNIIRGIFVGALIGIAVILLVLLLTALLISQETVEPKYSGYIACTALFIGSLSGALYAGRKVNGQKLIPNLLIALSIYVFLLIVTAVFYSGKYHGVGETALVLTGGALSAGLFTQRKRRTFRKRKVRI